MPAVHTCITRCFAAFALLTKTPHSSDRWSELLSSLVPGLWLIPTAFSGQSSSAISPSSSAQPPTAVARWVKTCSATQGTRQACLTGSRIRCTQLRLCHRPTFWQADKLSYSIQSCLCCFGVVESRALARLRYSLVGMRVQASCTTRAHVLSSVSYLCVRNGFPDVSVDTQILLDGREHSCNPEPHQTVQRAPADATQGRRGVDLILSAHHKHLRRIEGKRNDCTCIVHDDVQRTKGADGSVNDASWCALCHDICIHCNGSPARGLNTDESLSRAKQKIEAPFRSEEET